MCAVGNNVLSVSRQTRPEQKNLVVEFRKSRVMSVANMHEWVNTYLTA